MAWTSGPTQSGASFTSCAAFVAGSGGREGQRGATASTGRGALQSHAGSGHGRGRWWATPGAGPPSPGNTGRGGMQQPPPPRKLAPAGVLHAMHLAQQLAQARRHGLEAALGVGALGPAQVAGQHHARARLRGRGGSAGVGGRGVELRAGAGCACWAGGAAGQGPQRPGPGQVAFSHQPPQQLRASPLREHVWARYRLL